MASEGTPTDIASLKAVIGDTFRHWKGGLYRVSGLVRSSDDPDRLDVLYDPLYDVDSWDGIPWRRPVDEFFGPESRSATGLRFDHVPPESAKE